jgi:hypothetical protein
MRPRCITIFPLPLRSFPSIILLRFKLGANRPQAPNRCPPPRRQIINPISPLHISETTKAHGLVGDLHVPAVGVRRGENLVVAHHRRKLRSGGRRGRPAAQLLRRRLVPPATRSRPRRWCHIRSEVAHCSGNTRPSHYVRLNIEHWRLSASCRDAFIRDG